MINNVHPTILNGLCDAEKTVVAGRNAFRNAKNAVRGVTAERNWPVDSAESRFSESVIRRVALKPYGGGATQLPETALAIRAIDTPRHPSSSVKLREPVEAQWRQARPYLEILFARAASEIEGSNDAKRLGSQSEPEIQGDS